MSSGGGGKKGGGGNVTVNYHYGYSVAEVQVWEKDAIIWEARLGNTVLIGDGVTVTATIPNAWLKKFLLAEGSGYKKLYPFEITLYKNSLDTVLTSGVDYTYDSATGVITFTVAPTSDDLICGTWMYDEERPKETTDSVSVGKV